MAAHAQGWDVALLGASSLKGKEVRAVMAERGFPDRRTLLLDAEELQGQLTEFDGEPAVVQPVTEETFDGINLAVFASSPSFTERHWRQAQAGGARIIDLSYFLENEPQARLCAPLLGASAQDVRDSIVVLAHPAAVAIAGVLQRMSRRATVRAAVAMIQAPASNHGQAGVEELHQQTINLLSFQEIERNVFDAQVAFNTLPAYGEQSQPTLREEQERITRHLRSLLGETPVQPAVRLLHAPVFHSYSFLCWIELGQPYNVEELETELNQKPFVVSAQGELPNVVSAAGSDDILLGPVERDPGTANALWLWGVFDNLRIAALSAEHIAEAWFRAAEASTPPHENPRVTNS
jgi:aspartate-semialdehyde dehydrogenase